MIVQLWNDPAVILLCLMIILLMDNLWNLYLILREVNNRFPIGSIYYS